MNAAPFAVCTIAPRALLPQALVLARSFRQHHPDAPFALLVPDAFSLDREIEPAIEILSLDDIGLAPEDAHRLPRIYGSTELLLAVKPWLLHSLLERGRGTALYLDPDAQVLHSLDEIARVAQEAGVVIPIGRSEMRDAGFIAVSKKGEAFLSWWQGALQKHFNDGAPIDQSLFDRVPEQFPIHALDLPGWNIGYWNLAGHTLTASPDHYQLDEHPLRCFRFRGYDVERPHLLSREAGDQPRVLLSESRVLRKLCGDYRAKIDEQRAVESREPFGVLPSGVRIDRYMWRLHAESVRRYAQRQGPEPQNPFREGGEEAFQKWLNQRAFDGQPIITRYMLELHAARGDLQGAFPEPLGGDAAAFHSWFVITGAREEDVPERLLPPDAAAVVSLARGVEMPKVDTKELVVDVVGYFRAELGIGEAARLLVTGLEAADVRCNTFSFGETANRQEHAFDEQRARSGEAAIQIICVNADQLAKYAEQSGKRSVASRYTIGVWFWEVDEFPDALQSAFDHVDEVWVASHFVQQTLLKLSPVPVWKFPLPIAQPEIDPAATRSALGLPDGFFFLFNFDFLSVLERKNPVGLIEAFKRAFPAADGPALVIKTINGDRRIAETEKLKYAISARSDIRVIDGYMSAREKNTITALCDCYVSLHRSEGFGLTMAEAMALGKPVIATASSGNLEFMTSENSYLCSFRSVEVGLDREPYPSHAHWAEPDLDDASQLLRHVYEHREEAHACGARAAQDIARLHNAQLAGSAIAARLKRVRELTQGSPSAQRIARLEERLAMLRAAERAVAQALDEQRARNSAS